jgi:hypothetical protein
MAFPAAIPEEASQDRQQNALREKRGEDCRRPRSQSTANRHFPLPRNALGEQQIGNIYASDEEQETHCAQQQPKRSLPIAGQKVILIRLHERTPVLIACGIVHGFSRRDRIHLSLRLLDGDTGLEPARDQPVTGSMIVELLRLEDQRYE